MQVFPSIITNFNHTTQWPAGGLLCAVWRFACTLGNHGPSNKHTTYPTFLIQALAHHWLVADCDNQAVGVRVVEGEVRACPIIAGRLVLVQARCNRHHKNVSMCVWTSVVDFPKTILANPNLAGGWQKRMGGSSRRSKQVYLMRWFRQTHRQYLSPSVAEIRIQASTTAMLV